MYIFLDYHDSAFVQLQPIVHTNARLFLPPWFRNPLHGFLHRVIARAAYDSESKNWDILPSSL
jgi:hypothetical protein